MENNKGRLIVLEGIDGTGKTTQCSMLNERLTREGEVVKYHHFPSYGTYHGALVEHYLQGDFGNASDDSPYFVNSLYAIDRAIVWRKTLKGFYENGETILLDRYTTSSMVFQTAQLGKFSSRDEQKRFLDFVYDFEYKKLGIKEPDKVIFLRIPFELSVKLRNARMNNDGVANDIHESDLEFLRGVHETGIFVADYLSWEIIDCSKNGELLTREEIHEKIYTLLPKKTR